MWLFNKKILTFLINNIIMFLAFTVCTYKTVNRMLKKLYDTSGIFKYMFLNANIYFALDLVILLW